MYLTISLGVMVVVFAWFAKLQGKQNLVRALVNVVMSLFCLAWAAYRVGSGQHPVSYPSLLTDKQIEYLATLPPELFVVVGTVGLITAILVWAAYDAASRPHL